MTRVSERDTPTSYAREPDGVHPPLDHPPYRSTRLRHPKRPLVYLPDTITEITGPQLASGLGAPELDHDLTRHHEGEPIGEPIMVNGRVLDTQGKPLRGTLVETWQANAAGRYRHRSGRWRAPLDPNFSGAGRCITDDDDDDEGRYRFRTVKPGPYPWSNHDNAWRPAHIHFSLLGRAFAQRLVTQMYFPGDPLFPDDSSRPRLLLQAHRRTTGHQRPHRRVTRRGGVAQAPADLTPRGRPLGGVPRADRRQGDD